MSYSFFATVSRMKYIERWALMRSTRPENLSEHSLEVAMIAHALCTIGNVRFGRQLNAERAALIGLYHDASEIITGDMPTPVKYINRQLKEAYKAVEYQAEETLIERLPEDLRPTYREIFHPEEALSESSAQEGSAEEGSAQEDLSPEAAEERERIRYTLRLVKAADKLSALIKCIEEENAGNGEFRTARQTILEAVCALEEELPEVRVYTEEFLPAYGHTLDELS